MCCREYHRLQEERRDLEKRVSLRLTIHLYFGTLCNKALQLRMYWLSSSAMHCTLYAYVLNICSCVCEATAVVYSRVLNMS